MKNSPVLLATALAVLGGAGLGRAEPITALTTAGTLITFDSGSPGTLIGSPVTISGLTAGDALVGIDIRPIDGVLVGLGYNSAAGNARVYSINRTSGAATQINTSPVTIGTGVTSFGVDINPVPNALRIVTNATTGNNLRITAGGTGTINTDGNLNPGTPNPRAAAYSNNIPGGGGTTTLYVVDATLNALFTQGSVNGSPTSPNTGTLLNQVPLSGVVGANVVGFDISGTSGTALLSSDTSLFSLNLTSGAATLLGNFPAGVTVVDVTAVPEPGSLALGGMAAAGLIGLARRRRKKVLSAQPEC